MGNYKNSLMSKSKSDSIKYVEDSLKLLREKRAAGDKTDYIRTIKDEGKRFNFLRFIKSKHSKTGRFGARQIRDRNDSISALDTEGEKTDQSYFDPFALKIIIPKKEKGEGVDILTNSTSVQGAETDTTAETDTGIQGETKEDEGIFGENGIQSALVDDFTARVDEQIKLAQENDFEKSRTGMKSRMALAQNLLGNEDLIEQNNDSFNAGRSFKSDIGLKEEVPDSFAVRIGVSGPPAAYSQEYVQFNAKETKGLWAHIKGLFFKKPSEEEIFMKFAKSLPEYRQIMSIGKAEAAEAGMKYNAEEDPNIQNYFARLKADVSSNGTGHSWVKMIAKKDGSKLSEYSFGFVPVAESGMAGAVTGMVINPDNRTSAEVHEDAEISHSNYLRAAARIRGIVGSMRTYSTIGYNCTSFAVDIARTAGMMIKDDSSSSKIMTHRHYSQRVDTPYTLARHLKNGTKPNIERYIDISDTAFYQKKDDQKVSPQKLESMKKELVPMFESLPMVVEVSNINPGFKGRIVGLFEDLIKTIMIYGAGIDYLNPVANLKGAELAKMQQARIDSRIKKFGVATEQEYLAGLLNNEERLLKMLFNTTLDIDLMNQSQFWGDDQNQASIEEATNHFVDSKFMSTYYPGISYSEKLRIAGIILPKMWEVQKDITARNKKELKDVKGAELVKKIAERARDIGGARMLGYDIFGGVDFNDPEAVKMFLDTSHIDLPEAEKMTETQESELPPEINLPANISDDEMEEMVEGFGNVTVRMFMDMFGLPVGIEGYTPGGKKISYENVSGFLNRAKKNEKAFKSIATQFVRIKDEQDRRAKEELFKTLLKAILDNISLAEIRKIMSKSHIT